MKKAILPRVVYCGPEDSFFKKLSRNAEEFLLEARPTNFSGSPQKLAQSRKASLLILKIKNEFDLKQQEWLSKSDASVPVIVLSQNATIQTAIQALQYGIYDYFCASQSLDVILRKIREAVLWKSMKLARRHGESAVELLHGRNPEILRINEAARHLAHENRPVLFVGEPGTGKEHLAYGMYRLACRKLVPFIRYDCRLLRQLSQYDGRPVPEFIQSRLQEFRKRFSSGVFFLTHLEQLSADQQSEVLERGAKSSIRLMASCQENQPVIIPENAVSIVSSLKIPALRHHKDDIPILTEHFVRSIAQRRRTRMKAISEEILLGMQDYPWPGNIQELANVVERMMAIEPSQVLSSSSWRICQGYGVQLRADGTSQLSALLEAVLQSQEGFWKKGSLYDGFMREMEKILIDLVLPKVNNNQAIAAKILGISRNTLRERMKS